MCDVDLPLPSMFWIPEFLHDHLAWYPTGNTNMESDPLTIKGAVIEAEGGGAHKRL